ncbi:hypothetical protein DCS_04326 [Drechmeria coniospora]|uniref:Uncharacterized protein n=1 Tax=Drechmeria coniospora TaxID=98403 RepID=A0A151GJQ7_DRECN|nr:hypothetical protein DCS_04326 [Drechmeria coniospora]KYK57318.1 hypothetical protein DCS_04326 [Drechmeria coniospora]
MLKNQRPASAEYALAPDGESEDGRPYKLGDVPDLSPDAGPRSRSKSTPLRLCLVGAASSLVAILLFVALGLHLRGSGRAVANRTFPVVREGLSNKTGLPLNWSDGDCGNSPAEAMARNCRYSIVLFGWLPPGCHTADDAADEESMHGGQSWHYESEGRNMTMDELRLGNYRNFTSTYDMHLMHCMYVWKRMHRAMLNASIQMDSYSANLHHTEHCIHVLGESFANKGRDTGVIAVVKTVDGTDGPPDDLGRNSHADGTGKAYGELGELDARA